MLHYLFVFGKRISSSVILDITYFGKINITKTISVLLLKITLMNEPNIGYLLLTSVF